VLRHRGEIHSERPRVTGVDEGEVRVYASLTFFADILGNGD